MKNDRHRIPRREDDFHSFVGTTSRNISEPGPPPAWERLGLSLAEKDQWVAIAAQWNAIYAICSNKNTRTSTAIANKNIVRKAFISFVTPLLVRMSSNAALTEGDRLVYNLRRRDVVPTTRAKIERAPSGLLQPIGVATVRLRVRQLTDGDRCSIHPMADGVEVRYALVPADVTSGMPGAPATAADAPLYYISTKAISLLPLPDSASAKRLYVFFRWVNLSTPANNSPWSEPVQSIVL